MTHGSLFSGIGGFDLAAAWAGWTNVFNCEIDPFCRRVLKYHFPDRMVIASSNLSGEGIKERYGDRIYDRIKYLCYRVAFNGNSLRK